MPYKTNQGACMSNYFSCYISKTLYSIYNLLLTKIRVGWIGGLPLYMFLILTYF